MQLRVLVFLCLSIFMSIKLINKKHIYDFLRREVEQKDVISKKQSNYTGCKASRNAETQPELLYDLCATIEHSGTLYQGHYVSNVKVGNKWYYCNDAFVSETTEEEVLKSNEVYMMFYIRR